MEIRQCLFLSKGAFGTKWIESRLRCALDVGFLFVHLGGLTDGPAIDGNEAFPTPVMLTGVGNV